MVSASLQQEREKVRQKRKEGQTTAASQKKKASQREIVVPTVKTAIEHPFNFKELGTKKLIRDNGAQSIGSGTFGTCYPETYRSISVVIKKYKEKTSSCDSSYSLSLLQRKVKHEA